jgi:hypothetical protein
MIGPDATSAIGQAEILIDSGRLDEARIVLVSVAETFPENPWPRMLLGRVALASGSREEGQEFVQRALHIGEPRPELYHMAAQLLFNDGSAEIDGIVQAGLALFPRDATLLRFAVLRTRANANSRERRVVAIYGNCQAESIQNLAAGTPFLAERFTFLMVPTQAPGQGLPALPVGIERAELLWEQQFDHFDDSLHDVMRRRLPESCRVVPFPPIGLMCAWPFAVKNRKSHPEPGLPWGRYPFGDRVANQVAELQLPADRVFDSYMKLSREKMPDPVRLLERDRYLVAQAEVDCDVKISSYIAETIRTKMLFWSWGHPSNFMMSELLSRLCAHSTEVLGNDLQRDDALIQAVLENTPESVAMHVPIHPDIIERLGMTCVDADSKYDWFGHRWTFKEYITRYITGDRSWQAAEGLAAACMPPL